MNYYEGNTLDSLAKKTKISRNSLFTTIDKVRELIKDELDEEYLNKFGMENKLDIIVVQETWDAVKQTPTFDNY